MNSYLTTNTRPPNQRHLYYTALSKNGSLVEFIDYQINAVDAVNGSSISVTVSPEQLAKLRDAIDSFLS